ncbi:MAG: helix-turn-helix domain-containing protein [Candidatus Moranbacteria bacterium]|nr:helix-turn-helix domain-containing protein [Candidatus Moranbacteria bacterium]
MIKKHFTTAEMAKILGISRIAVFKKIKSGKLKAEKIGRIYAIERKNLPDIFKKEPSEKEKKEIEKSVRKTVKEYKETLILLGKE